jgi:tetratricopeptide (TPR) repeat protein
MASKRDKILKNAEKLVQKGKVEQAIREYEKILKANPNDPNTINRVGDLYGRIGQIDKAVELFERLAGKFASDGFTPKAIAIYKKINRLAPQRLDIFERLGDLYVEQGLTIDAKNQFQMLAEHYVKNDDMESAIRVHERLGSIDPGDHTSRLKFADLLLESGDMDKAMSAYGDLGESLIDRDQLDEAERLYRRLLKHEFPDGEIMAPICARLLEVGRVTAVQELLTAGLEVSPQSVLLQTLQVRTHLALGETDAAVKLAKEVLEIDPENLEVLQVAGNVLMASGEKEHAVEIMIPAAETLLDQAEYSRAQKLLQDLVEVAPSDERVLRLAIRAFRPSGDQERLFALTAALAQVYYDSGQEDQSKRLYMELVAADPANQLFRERLAQLDGVDVEVAGGAAAAAVPETELPSEIDFDLGASDDQVGGEAVDESDEIVVDEPPTVSEVAAFDPEERLAEAAVFAKYGLNDKALVHLEEVVRERPDHLGAREELGKLYVTLGKTELAASTIAPVIDDHRQSGRHEEAEELEALVESVQETSVGDEEEVIFLDLDEGAPDDVPVAEPEPEPEPEPELEPSATEIQEPPLELDDRGPDGLMDDESGGVEAGLSFDSGVIDFSEVAGAAQPSSPAVEEPPVEAPPVEMESRVLEDDLVEISTGFAGPPASELAQLDLFIQQELLDDAVGILKRLEADYPEDSELADRREHLEAVGAMDEAAEVESAEEVDEKEIAVEVEPPADESSDRIELSSDDLFAEEAEEEYVDLAKELEMELAKEEAMVEEATGRGKGEALLEEVFREFKKGVAEQLSEEDSDTHFNLGIAYKEMGLLDEAIAEFQVASHDIAFFVEACTMIGICLNDQGKHDEAAEWYQKALVAPDLSLDSRTALRYELASALEKTGKFQQAIDLFEEILAHDRSYRDVSDRLEMITQQQRQIN